MSTFFSRARTAVEAFINLLKGEVSAASKRVDAIKHLTEHNIIFERGCRIFSYAQGSDCDLTGTTNVQLVLASVKNSVTGTLGNSQGIVWAGDVVYVFNHALGAKGYVWRKVATLNDTITITNSDLIYPTGGTVADYTALTASDLDIVVVGREDALKLGEDELAISILAGGLNAQSLVIEDNMAAGTEWGTAGDNLETGVLTKITTALDANMTPAGVLIDDIIAENNLNSACLSQVRCNLIPDSNFEHFDLPNVATKGYPVGFYIIRGDTAPTTSAPAVTATEQIGNHKAWNLGIDFGQRVGSRCFAPVELMAKRFRGLRLRYIILAKRNAGSDEFSLNISDSVVTAGTAASTVLTADYKYFYVDRTIDVAATWVQVALTNITPASAGSSMHIAAMFLQVVSDYGDHWIPDGPYYDLITKTYSFKALTVGLFSGTDQQENDGAGNDPFFPGIIAGIHSYAMFKTVDGTGATKVSQYHCNSAGTEAEDTTYEINIPVSTKKGVTLWSPNPTLATPELPILTAGGDYGTYLAHKINTAGGGTPAGLRITSKIWVIR